jgi:hypothetical protein
VKLITAHRILIGAAIAFFVFYAAFQLRRYGGGQGPGALLQAIASTAVAIGLVVYYRRLRDWGS